MEEKKDFERLFVLYLMKELDIEEERYVTMAINIDPVVKANFEKCAKAWKLLEIKENLDAIDIEEELNQFEVLYEAKSITKLIKFQPVIKDIPEVVHENGGYSRIIGFSAVAASLFVMTCIGWLFFQPKTEKVAANSVQPVVIKLLARVVKNVSGKLQTIQLQDGSNVLLWDKSEIKFTEPFVNDKREISLKGKAGFKVAKDKSKPFSVFSGDIYTTALGTAFTVTNFEKEHLIRVQLHEGKVVVKSVDSIKAKLNRSFYLLPGQEFVYDKRSATGKICRIQKPITKNENKNRELINENPSVPKHVEGAWYMFNNQSLSVIFDQLRSMYGAEIVYRKMDVDKLYFIGRFEKTDSLEYILKNIAAINKLTFTKENNRFIIRK